MKLVAEFDKNDKSVQALSAEILFSTKIETQKSKIDTLRSALENAAPPLEKPIEEHKTGRFS